MRWRQREGQRRCPLPSLPGPVRMPAALALKTKKATSILAPGTCSSDGAATEGAKKNSRSLYFLISEMKELLRVFPTLTTSYPMKSKLLNNPGGSSSRGPSLTRDSIREASLHLGKLSLYLLNTT